MIFTLDTLFSIGLAFEGGFVGDFERTEAERIYNPFLVCKYVPTDSRDITEMAVYSTRRIYTSAWALAMFLSSLPFYSRGK